MLWDTDVTYSSKSDKSVFVQVFARVQSEYIVAPGAWWQTTNRLKALNRWPESK